MTSTVSFDLDRLLKTSDQLNDESKRDTTTSYWTPQNHQAGTGNTYLRLEEWMQDLQDYVLPVRQTASSIDITLDMGRALLRYREELKMMAAIHNQDHPHRLLDGMDDVHFLHARHQAIKTEWPLGKETSLWWRSLEDLMRKIDEAILHSNQKTHTAGDTKNNTDHTDNMDYSENNTENNRENKDNRKNTENKDSREVIENEDSQAVVEKDPTGGIFIKLSVRSPKDSAMLMESYRQHLRDYIDKSDVAVDSIFALGDDVAAIRYANWQSTRCRTSEEALLLLVRSDRVYMDIQHHELFCEGDKQTSFHLQLHISAFFDDFDPAYEFRGFVSNGKRTALTIYNPWVYDEKLIATEEFVLQKIVKLWDDVTDKIRSENYSLDFAFSKDLQQVWIVELNNFLPPLAGSGLFKFHEEKDKEIILNGPFEFRIRKTAVVKEDFAYDRIDATTGKTLHVIMQPATDEIMSFVRNLRRLKCGLPEEGTEESVPITTRKMNCIIS